MRKAQGVIDVFEDAFAHISKFNDDMRWLLTNAEPELTERQAIHGILARGLEWELMLKVEGDRLQRHMTPPLQPDEFVQ